MTNETDQDRKKPLSLGGRGKLELKRPVETASVRQSFSHGRSKTVTVEVKRKRPVGSEGDAPVTETKAAPPPPPEPSRTVHVPPPPVPVRKPRALRELTEEEKAARVRAIQMAVRAEAERKVEEERRRKVEEERARIEAEQAAIRAAEEEIRRKEEETRLAAEAAAHAAEEARKAAEEAAKPKPAPAPVAADKPAAAKPAQQPQLRETPSPKVPVSAAQASARTAPTTEEEDESARAKKGPPAPKRPAPAPVKRADERRRTGKITVTQALDQEDTVRMRSLASMRRARERERQRQMQRGQEKVIREVIVPDNITVQDLAARMAERSGEVIKALMRIGVMATINQLIDADTAELVVAEFGHTVKRASESDVEIGVRGNEDVDDAKLPRAPVVTVMGHVDHGKTSLLDALRKTDVASREAGGITQHIGAYRVQMEDGNQITFIDTPGHEAFTEMRARGANVTDIVVLVVAADDGIMPQTVEAIQHAKAANVPIIVAINKCDKPDADPQRVRTELLSHSLVVEELGGDVLAVEVSAKTGLGLEKLEESILLQAEVLDLRANPNRAAEGIVIEAKLDRGRGPVATVLVQRGTLSVGDVFVCGAEWGRVRALVNDRGEQVKEIGPSQPAEVLGLQGTPHAGDELSVVENESRAREVAEFRQRKRRDQDMTSGQRGTVEQMLSKIAAGESKELPVVVKTDVQGSLEAIMTSLNRIDSEEVSARILFGGVGAVSESDIILAKASNALVIAFNVRANNQARDLARRDNVDIRYYSVIYNVIDDVKKALSGLLAPDVRENFLGYAEIRQIFDTSKTGRVAGCMVTEGMVKRGSKVRLLRDNVVIHEGSLKTLRRFKDEVREVKQGFECGMAFEHYSDIKDGDVIECFELVEEARTL